MIRNATLHIIRAVYVLLLATPLLIGFLQISSISSYAMVPLAVSENDTSNENNTRVAQGARLSGEAPPIDGTLDHPAWDQAEVITGFIQRHPDSGEPASQPTEVKLLYDDMALYVGARMYDDEPDRILAPLMHQDSPETTDWFAISIDSYKDGRTAFTFIVNPRGVRLDQMQYNDYQEDNNWTANWDAGATINEEGWTATMRIPLSQLRYAGGGEQAWGINFARMIARNNEQSFWADLPPDQMRMVSLFGTLEGIELPEQRLRLEATPYLASSLNRKHPDLQSPLEETTEFRPSVGLDLQYGLTPGLTLTTTIYPDFGQVQVDPAVINLTAFETFFPERRQFFMEGSEIFNVDGTRTYNVFGRPTSFYTRRIGAPPEASVPDGNYDDIRMPSETDIIGAVKLSGQAPGGWSLGVMDAVTGRERAEVLYADGETASHRVSPVTNRFMGVAEKQFNDGSNRLGLHAGAVNRFADQAHLRQQLVDDAYLAGMNFEYLFADGAMAASGVLQTSHQRGNAEAIDRLQRHPARYYQRPDAGYLDYRPDRTSLTGLHSELSLARLSGDWTGSVTWNTISPGFDVNDMGFQTRGDFHSISGIVRYADYESTRLLDQWNALVRNETAWDYGGRNFQARVTGNLFMRFLNNWQLALFGGVSPETYDPDLTRGGPVARTPASASSGFRVFSDQARVFDASLGANYERDRVDNSTLNIGTRFNYKPFYSVSIRLAPEISFREDRAQYITAIEDPAAEQTYGSRYVFSELDLITVDVGINLRWTFSPDLNLQLYAQPLLSSGRFSRFKEFNEPGTYRFEVYGEDTGVIEELEEGYRIIPEDGNSFEIGDPDFIRRSLRANAVLNWEFRPGSHLYLVWQLNQFDHDPTEGVVLDPLKDFGQLVGSPTDHTLMIKITRWFSR